MGIDRIGKGGTAPPPDLDKVGKSDAVEKPFTAERAERPKAAGAVDATQTASPLAQLKSGAIDVDRYLDLKVDEATKAIDGISPAKLAEIKKVLREQLASDPTLVDMVRSATGKLPTPSQED